MATKFPALEADQVALILSEVKTGHVLKLNRELYLGEGEFYHVFDSILEAKEFAKKAIQENSEIESVIFKDNNKAVFFINSLEEKEL